MDAVAVAESSNPPNRLGAELAAGAAVELSVPAQQQRERVELQIEDADVEDLFEERDGNDRETEGTTAGFIKESDCASSHSSNSSSESSKVYAAPTGGKTMMTVQTTRST